MRYLSNCPNYVLIPWLRGCQGSNYASEKLAGEGWVQTQRENCAIINREKRRNLLCHYDEYGEIRRCGCRDSKKEDRSVICCKFMSKAFLPLFLAVETGVGCSVCPVVALIIETKNACLLSTRLFLNYVCVFNTMREKR